MRLRTLISLAVLVGASPAIADDAAHRQLGPHEHGHGALNIAIEGAKVTLELEVPGDDIAGFEHKAVTDQDKATIAKVTGLLSKPLAMFQMPEAAGCALLNEKVEIAPEKQQPSAAVEPGEHSEFHNFYTLECKAPAALLSVGFDYFKQFEHAQSLTVTIISDKGQSHFDVTRDNPQIDLKAIM